MATRSAHHDETTHRRTTVSGEPTVQDTLEALSDPACREILATTRTEPRTASEIVEACDLAQSTAYRKLDELTDAGLLGERIRLRPSGKHASEYVPALEDVVVSLDRGGDFELHVS